MRDLNRSTVYIALGTLLIGVLLGWLLFGGGSPQSGGDEHNHKISESSVWTCSMHPQIRQPEPGKCPLCGMNLIPLGGEVSEGNPMEIKMSPTAMQLANIQTSILVKKNPVKEIRLSGKVKADERYVFSQTSHISGRIEKLLVNYTGEYVSKGQVIAFIYSPELVTAQDELFEAIKIKEAQPGLYKAAVEKLKNWKLTDQQIDGIVQSGKPIEHFPILSDLDGVVLTKRINLGDHVKQGSSMFEIADLSKIWVMFDIYESDMQWVKKNDEVQFQVQSLPGEKFTGTISFIDPVFDVRTRVARARVELDNHSKRLKPEMFVSGIVKSALINIKEALVIPKSAVMWTGERSVVYVKNTSSSGLSFEMRKITLGASLGDGYIVIDGLMEGEEVATNGTFSIDAAAQLAGKPSMMNPDGGMVMAGHNHSNMKTNDDKELSISILEFEVNGVCTKCKKRIEGSLIGESGIISANWNVDSKLINVEYDQNVIKEMDIHQKIASVGHDTDKMKAEDSVYD
ncbi:MAG: efflux RND transporter periplasmic adaptor subunit, partial [Bacteroidetes bacterium]|nr:efflux RND transporter periplasmic adaptor subunit [Bacteroidota bacterium]